MNNLIIRRNKVKDLVLSCNKEKVYFLYQFGQLINNSMNYDLISDQYDKIVKGE